MEWVLGWLAFYSTSPLFHVIAKFKIHGQQFSNIHFIDYGCFAVCQNSRVYFLHPSVIFYLFICFLTTFPFSIIPQPLVINILIGTSGVQIPEITCRLAFWSVYLFITVSSLRIKLSFVQWGYLFSSFHFSVWEQGFGI